MHRSQILNPDSPKWPSNGLSTPTAVQAPRRTEGNRKLYAYGYGGTITESLIGHLLHVANEESESLRVTR